MAAPTDEEAAAASAAADAPHLPADGLQATLELLAGQIADAWESFARPRPREPALDGDLLARLGQRLPERPNDPGTVLADAARVLDASVSPARPLYLAYIGSTGLEVGVLAEALAATYDVNLAVTARAADLVEQQAVRWVAEFVGYPCAEGAFTSGGMISNLTGILVARERALPGCRADGLRRAPGAPSTARPRRTIPSSGRSRRPGSARTSPPARPGRAAPDAPADLDAA